MCGIIGYTGDGRREAGPILLAGLRRLEYRGYDSAGVALQSDSGLVTRKLAGRVAGLQALLDRRPLHGVTGIAHTRWATHGAPTPRNAHPHVDCRETLALVHNGIVENADALRAALERAGHTFRTETDTETLVHLIEDSPGDTLEARVISALENVVGTYGIAVISADEPGKIVVARQGSPVLLGIGENEYFVASDASAILEYTRSVVHLDDGDIAVLTPDGYHVIDRQAHVQLREVDDVTWDLDAIELKGFARWRCTFRWRRRALQRDQVVPELNDAPPNQNRGNKKKDRRRDERGTVIVFPNPVHGYLVIARCHQMIG